MNDFESLECDVLINHRVVGSVKFSDEYHADGFRASMRFPEATEELVKTLCRDVVEGRSHGILLSSSHTPAEPKFHEVPKDSRASYYPTFTPPAAEVSIDERKFISYWASELKKIYDNQTAGDYTFEGVVSTILRDFTNPPRPDLLIHGKWETK